MLLAKGSPLYLGYLCLEWKVELYRVSICPFLRGNRDKDFISFRP